MALTTYGPTCDCPDFSFRRDGLDPRGCLHIRAMLAVGMLKGGWRTLAIAPILSGGGLQLAN